MTRLAVCITFVADFTVVYNVVSAKVSLTLVVTAVGINAVGIVTLFT
jgi:hypothetical protein